MATIQLSGFTDEIAESFDEQLRVASSLGLKYIEIRGVDGKNIADLTPEEVQVAAQKLKAAGMAVSSVGSPCGKQAIEEDFGPHFAQFKAVCKTAKALGARYIRMFSFFMPAGEDPAAYREPVLARLTQMVEYAKEQSLVLLHENEKGIYGDDAARCLDILTHFSSPNLRAVFDFANFVQVGQPTRPAYDTLLPFIEYIHIKDAKADTGLVVPAGAGDGELPQILASLQKAGYTGFLSLEPHLADFAGFAALENDDAKLQKAADNTATFTLAHTALVKILNSLGWRYS